MKTTAGKTKPPPKRARKIYLFADGQCLGYTHDTSLRKALSNYFKEYIAPLGGTFPHIIGNVLTIIAIPPGELPPGSYPSGQAFVSAVYENDIRI